jgi:hypothetical protein
MDVRIPVSAGELVDKIAILEIKSARIADPAKLVNVRAELALLAAVRDKEFPATPEMRVLAAELKGINEELWEIEDAIRDCARAGDFSRDSSRWRAPSIAPTTSAAVKKAH